MGKYIGDSKMQEFLKENMDVDSFIQSLLIKYVTARIDIKNIGNEDNSIEIISNSDLDAKINFPEWLKDETGSGLTIQSDKCFLYLELKCINDGTLNIKLKGIDTRDKNDKRFPIYIDYMKLAINDEDYLNNNKLDNSIKRDSFISQISFGKKIKKENHYGSK